MTRRTLTNWFHDYWFVQVPRNTDRYRVYDQLFIDGTFSTPHASSWPTPSTTSSPVAGAPKKTPTTTPDSSINSNHP
ncbi:hypothetical protein cgR_6130 [Corynebacterium glutamicum R]|uniref:Uncharacterized protein n=1 Tax=Corynebacterium glutamicum (strain R) TaxID=340322 RepID=A0AB72VFA7_CORGB|nr:hypothetical protein cgR_6130 [Corynebacterium glutamicum R]